jgi:molybdate transport repressor ModE-like protein
MSQLATTTRPAPAAIRWSWDFGNGLGPQESVTLVALLAALQRTGTLGKAAREAGLSYRAAWGLLRRGEHCFGAPLADRARGRGTALSGLGARLVRLHAEARPALAEMHAPWIRRLEEAVAPSRLAMPARLSIAASHDLALADWIENGRHVAVDIRWHGSEAALTALARGECDAAGFHLPVAWGREQAAAWLGRWLTPQHHVFLPVMLREHGLLVEAANPYALATVADVARLGLRLVNRQRGSGTRSMIDELLTANGLHPADIPGYAHEEFTHDAVAAAIAAGAADVGVGIRAAAARYDLGFVPLGWDLYCLVMRPAIAGSAAVRHLVRRLRGNTFRDRLQALSGYLVEDRHDRPLAWEPFLASRIASVGTAAPPAGIEGAHGSPAGRISNDAPAPRRGDALPDGGR